MKKIMSVVVLLLVLFTLSGCSDSDPCGDGTSLVDGVCVLDDNTNDDIVQQPTAVTCSNETGLHSVAGGKPYSISSWLNWTFIGGQFVNDPDNAWIKDYGAAVFDVKTVADEPWMGSFTQSKMFLTKGCEYTFEFTLRTEAQSLKPDVIVFGENTSGVSFFEEEVALNTSSTTYRYTVIPTTSDYVSTGVYFAGSRGMVVIEEVQIERNPIGTNTTSN